MAGGPPVPAIGIDLGTTFSCVALFRKGKVEVIANEHSNRTTPSYVAFTETQRLTGEEAKKQAGLNPTNTVFGVKRLIGRQFNDLAVQHDAKQWPFNVVSERGDPRIQVAYKGEKKLYSAIEISSMILSKMKSIADTFVGQPVTKAVITVPAYFNDAQRQATKSAGEAAGLEVLRILNEPTAAGIAYGYDDKSEATKKNILVFDLGGGTFDVSILTIENGVYEVRASSGDTHLGGEDFDTCMVEHFLVEIKKKLSKDISGNRKAMYRLRAACEQAKRSLACADSTSIDIDSLVDGEDFKSNISRTRFDLLNKSLYEKIFTPLERALQDAKMDKSEIDDIVLVGGSSRIHGVQDKIRKYLNGKELTKNINPDEAVAYGAAIQAAVLIGDKDPTLLKFRLNDVIPLSLGMEVVGGKMAFIIHRNTKLPTSESQTFTTHFDNQPAISVVIYEGERELVEDNNRLGEFVVTDIPKARREVPKIEVTFEVDKDGILNVSAVITGSGIEMKKHIDKPGVISHDEIQRMIEDARQFKEDDERERNRIDCRLKLEDFCLEMQSKAAYGSGLPSADLAMIEEVSEDTLTWIRDNDLLDAEEYTDKLKELHRDWDKKLAKLQ